MRLLISITEKVVAMTLPKQRPHCFDFVCWGRTALALVLSLTLAGLMGCGNGDEGNVVANEGGQGANDARKAPGRPNPARQREANSEPRKQNEGKGRESQPDGKHIVATPWSRKDVAEWTMLDYQNAITNKDVKYVQALEKRVAAAPGDVQVVQELTQLLVLVAQMSDDGQNPDLFDSRGGIRRRVPNVRTNRGNRRSSRYEEDDEDE